MDSSKPLDTFLLYNEKDKHYKKIAPMYVKDVPEYLVMESDKVSKRMKELKDKPERTDGFQEIREHLMPELYMMQHHKNIVSFILTHLNDCQFINTATI
jgi:hypothetical protein